MLLCLLFFVVRISGLLVVEDILGVFVIVIGFGLDYIAFINWRNGRDKWKTYLLIPVFLFFYY
jgi:hypothetical protein